jgi:hypothetical protein
MTPMKKPVNDYLTSLRRSLKSLPTAERDEVVSEITAHIRDSLEQGLTVEQILSQLGTAQELAAQYRDTVWVERASRARTPWSMLQSVFWLAKRGAIGGTCFFVALIGYASGVSLIVTALLKPFFPNQIGLWVGPGVLHFGFHDAGRAGGGVGLVALTGGPAHEVLGRWYIPVTCALGAFFIWGTTKVLRRLVKRIKTKNTGSILHHQSPKPMPLS